METTAPQGSASARSSSVLTAAIGVAFLVISIVFAASTSWYAVFETVHVICAVVWVGGGTLFAILALLAERRRDPVELATIVRQAAYVGMRVFAPAGLIVVAMGVAMMINGDLDWAQFWVIAGLVGYASTFVTGLTVLSPSSRKVAALLDAKGATAPETQAAIARILLIARVDIAVLLLVTVDMVAKPFA
jgi:uncharacterized membrane protein